MSTGNILYLLMCVGTFSIFGILLAYESWQQSRHGGDFGAAKQQHPQTTAGTEVHA